MKKNKVLGWSLLFLIVVIVIGAIVFFANTTHVDVFNASLARKESALLLWSFEYRDDAGVHIVSFLLIADAEKNTIGILEIPAQLGIYDAKRSLYIPVADYYRDDGYERYQKALADAIKVETLEYIFMNDEMLSDFVDLIGGIRLFIIEETSDVQNAAQIGNVRFDGPDVAAYLQSIETKNDELLLIASKRKDLMSSLLRGLQENASLFSNKKIMKRFFSKVHTSLSYDNMLAFNEVLVASVVDKLFYQRINGIRRSVVLDDVERSILFINSEVGSIAQIVSFFKKQIQTSDVAISSNKASITILNGTVINGLARKVKEIYESAGFQVLSIGNASRNDIKQTSIIDRVGNKVAVDLAAKVIDVRTIITDISTVDSAGASITLILGEDFDGERVRK